VILIKISEYMSNLKVFYTDHYEVELPAGHRFPMFKYRLLRETLLEKQVIDWHQLEPTPLLDDNILLFAHSEDYVNQVKNVNLDKNLERLSGFPQSKSMYYRSLASVCATVLATEHALNYGIAATISGGTHHAYKDRGEGFCIFNDVAVAINYFKHQKKIKRPFVIDLDVHQGNGTAAIFQNDPQTFTFSFHGEKNYPFRKEKSDFDFGFPPHTTDSVYLFNLQLYLSNCIEKHNPDILFYNAGVDILKEDQLGSLDISLQGCLERDMMVFYLAQKFELPIVVVMGGGYAKPISPTIQAQLNLFQEMKHFNF